MEDLCESLADPERPRVWGVDEDLVHQVDKLLLPKEDADKQVARSSTAHFSRIWVPAACDEEDDKDSKVDSEDGAKDLAVR